MSSKPHSHQSSHRSINQWASLDRATIMTFFVQSREKQPSVKSSSRPDSLGFASLCWRPAVGIPMDPAVSGSLERSFSRRMCVCDVRDADDECRQLRWRSLQHKAAAAVCVQVCVCVSLCVRPQSLFEQRNSVQDQVLTTAAVMSVLRVFPLFQHLMCMCVSSVCVRVCVSNICVYVYVWLCVVTGWLETNPSCAASLWSCWVSLNDSTEFGDDGGGRIDDEGHRREDGWEKGGWKRDAERMERVIDD